MFFLDPRLLILCQNVVCKYFLPLRSLSSHLLNRFLWNKRFSFWLNSVYHFFFPWTRFLVPSWTHLSLYFKDTSLTCRLKVTVLQLVFGSVFRVSSFVLWVRTWVITPLRWVTLLQHLCCLVSVESSAPWLKSVGPISEGLFLSSLRHPLFYVPVPPRELITVAL